MNIKTIGVLTSGGDAPGMNAAIRAVTRTALSYGIRVMGVRRGYNGLMNGDIVEMDARSVSDIMQRGGTVLQTARCLEFKEMSGVQRAVDVAREFGIDGLIVIGGDGSFRGARDLCSLGLPTIGVPGTIDNDISCTDYTIGFDTALNTAVELVDKLRDTMSSHERCSVVEVMGNRAGYIALHCAIACGAEAVLIPEKGYDLQEDIIKPIEDGKKRGKKHDIIIIAEGVGGTAEIAKAIEEQTGIIARTTILGHVQRGGTPTAQDRVIASRMGGQAVRTLIEGRSNRVIVMRENKIFDMDITEALEMKKEIETDIAELAKRLAI